MKHISQLKKDDILNTFTYGPVERMDLIKYSGASGDYNPIHLIDDEAENLGLPGIIAHGMWTMGSLAKIFTPYYEDGFIEQYNVKFANMVFLQDVLTFQAKVVEVTETHITFDIKVVNQNNQDILVGDVTFSLYK